MIRADLDEPYGWPVVEQTFALCISAGVYECLSESGRLPRPSAQAARTWRLAGLHVRRVRAGPSGAGLRVGRADSGIPNPIADLAGWHLHRHSLDRVAGWLNDLGFEFHYHHQIEADIHSHFSVPIYYRLVVARAPK